MTLFEASPLSRAYIERLTWGMREALALTDHFLPVTELLEFGLAAIAPGVIWEVRERAEMRDRHGYLDPERRILALREDVYDGLVEHRGRDRFTTCHEIGHAVLHRSTLNRVRPGTEVKAYANPEWQADEFAGTILMPRHMMLGMTSIDEIVREFGVTEAAARTRARVLKLRLPW